MAKDKTHNANRLNNRIVKEHFAQLSLPNFEGVDCQTMIDGGKKCSMWFYYDLDHQSKISPMVSDHPQSIIFTLSGSGEGIWTGTSKVNRWVKQEYRKISTLLKERIPSMFSVQLSKVVFVMPFPPINLCIPERWDHVPINEASKINVLRPNNRNPNAPKAYTIIGFPSSDDHGVVEKVDLESGTVFKPVAAARELTMEEIEQRMKDDIMRSHIERDLRIRQYFRFVGGSPFSDECWELVRYPGLRIIVSGMLPPETVRMICETRVKATDEID